MRLLSLVLALNLTMTGTASAENPAIHFEASGLGGAPPTFIATANGQGLRCNYASYAQLPGSGFIRRDQGTIELKVKLEHDLRPYDEYRTLLSIPPAPGQAFSNQLSLVFTPDASKLGYSAGDLVFILKIAHDSYKAQVKGLDWKAGSEHAITASWGPVGMRVFIDGELAAQNPYTGGFESEAPDFICLGRHVTGSQPANLILDELKISDIQRDDAYMADQSKTDGPPQLDADTLVLMHFDGSLAVEGAATEWRSSRSSILAVNPRDFGIDSAANNVFSDDEAVSLDAALFNLRPGGGSPVTLTATARTYRGREAAKIQIQVTPQAKSGWQNVTVPLPLRGKVGWYSVTVELSDGHNVLSSFTTPCVVIPPAPKSRYEFGLDDYGSTVVPWLTLKRLGIKWVRPHNGHWNWNVVEARKGEFDFTLPDADVAGAAANGIKILAVLGLTPDWAAVPPDNADAFKGGPNEWKELAWKYCWRPGNLEDYRNYVTHLVGRYKGKGIYWEHYNEPDWHLPQTVGFAYGGTTAQFVAQMKINAEVVRQLDPTAKLVFPGIACLPISDGNFVRDVIAMGGMKYVDIAAMHSYGGYPFFASQMDLFRQAGYKGEIWQTEKLTSRDNMPGAVYQDMYMLQIPDILETMALGVPVYIAHPLFDYLQAGVPQIEAFTIPFFYRMVGERTYAGRIPGTNVHFFDGKEGPLVVCYSQKDLKIKVGQDKVTLTDLFGESSVVDAPNGTLSLKGSPEVRYITPAPGQPFTLAQVAPATPTAGQLANGNFEDLDGDAGLGAMLPRDWAPSPSHNKGRYAADTAIHEEGKASLREESPPDDKESSLQDIALTSGSTYEISGWIRTESAQPPPADGTSAEIAIWSRTLGQPLVELLEKNVNSGEFNHYTARFTVPAGTPDNVVSCSVYAGTDKAWFDNIELKEIKP